MKKTILLFSLMFAVFAFMNAQTSEPVNAASKNESAVKVEKSNVQVLTPTQTAVKIQDSKPVCPNKTEGKACCASKMEAGSNGKSCCASKSGSTTEAKECTKNAGVEAAKSCHGTEVKEDAHKSCNHGTAPQQ